MKRTYFVKSFELANVSTSCLVVTDGRTWRVDSSSVLALLQALMAKARTYISEEELEALVGDSTLSKEEAISFLRRDAGILLEIEATSKKFSEIIFFSDTSIPEIYISSFMKKEGIAEVKVVDNSEDLALSIYRQPDMLAVVLLQDYDTDLINNLSATVYANKGAGYLVGYMIGSVLNIDNPYVPGYGLPTHADHMYQWRKIMCEGNTSSKWLDLLDLYHENDAKFKNPYRLDRLEQFLCAFHLIKRTSQIVGCGSNPVHINQLLYASRLNVVDGTCSVHTVSHSDRRASHG